MATERTPQILDMTPLPVNLCLTREDSFPIQFQMESDTPGLDFTGSSFAMNCNTAADGSGTAIFSLTPSNTPGTDLIIEFTPSVSDTDIAPGTYYYDIEWVDVPGNVRTIIKGTLEIFAQITGA